MINAVSSLLPRFFSVVAPDSSGAKANCQLPLSTETYAPSSRTVTGKALWNVEGPVANLVNLVKAES